MPQEPMSLPELLAAAEPKREGRPSAYLERLPDVDLDALAVATCSVDGDVEAAGDADVAFPLQSVSKAFVYAFALQDLGLREVLEHVGVEPSGEAFDEASLTAGGRPFNPLINAGAVMVHGLVPGDDVDDRMGRILTGLSALAGRDLAVDEAVLDAELGLGHRNLAIAHLLTSYDVLPDDPHELARGYTMQCAVSVTSRDLAVMGATLANGGVHPVTGERVLDEDVVRQTLSVMLACGMYDASGQWVAEVGLPAKSGVSGCVLAVVPSLMGVAAYSPRLDDEGNSVRGLEVCEQLSESWGLHLLRHDRDG